MTENNEPIEIVESNSIVESSNTCTNNASQQLVKSVENSGATSNRVSVLVAIEKNANDNQDNKVKNSGMSNKNL